MRKNTSSKSKKQATVETTPSLASVLVVDDQASIRETMVITFRREGYDVQSAESGEQAMEIISRIPLDVVITDLRLSGMNGIEVLI